MTWNVVIACIDTRNPPEKLNALASLDIAVHRVIGFHDERESALYQEADAIITEMHPVTEVNDGDLQPL